MFTRVIMSILAFGSLVLAAAAFAASLAQQSSNANGVSVEVTPHAVGADGMLAFDVALNTHSGSLSEDLRKSAVLVTDGKTHQPTGWKGDAAGGHHRKGVLTFAQVPPQTKVIELKLTRPGEPIPRLFRWNVH